MAIKTRAQLKSENAADFPDNATRLISPADLRGQMDDVVDSAVFPEDGGVPGPAGDVRFVADIATMRALPDLAPGSIIFVGNRMDQFVVVNDATLGSDGGTVFIPNSELSALTSEVIPTTAFAGATGVNIAMEYALAHTGIDFESVELVVTDAGETISVWQLHGHVMNSSYPERADHPQLPNIITGSGKFCDPEAWWTAWKGAPHPPLRTGGALLRYKYATSGLRLKRLAGPVFQLRWWPVIAVEDEAPGVQTDNSGKICWCCNAAAAAGAEAVLIDKMYHYQRVVEWPDRVEMRGLGPGRSGFRVMDNGQFKELLLSTSQDGAAADPTLIPINKPATRQWAYDAKFYSHATAFFPASGSTRTRISGIEFDGNIDNNLRLFSETDTSSINLEYAFKYANSSIHLFNTPASAAFAVTDHQLRVIPAGHILEVHNCKMHGYAHLIMGNHHSTTIGTGLLELGNVITGHWGYLSEGVFETVHCFGYTGGEGLRCRKFIAKSVECRPAPMPPAIFHLSDITTPPIQNYAVRVMSMFSLNETPQSQNLALGYPYPELSRAEIVIDHLFIDFTGLDDWPTAYAYQSAIPFLVGADNIHIKSGRIRFGSKAPATAIINSNVNNPGLAPYRNQAFENLLIEYGSRAGMQLFSAGTFDPGASQLNFRNVTFEPRAATHIPGNPSPSGTTASLGNWRFKENIPTDPAPPNYSIYDGRDVEFSAVAADATLNGKYIDITPPDPVASVYRLWFNYNSLGSAPAAGATTLVPVPVASGATTATVAQAFSLAVGGTIASPGVPSPYLTAATYNTKSVIGAFSHYRDDTKGGYVACDVSHAAGVTTALRAHRRNYEPSVIGFERFIASDQSYLFLIQLFEVGTNRNIFFTFKDCIFGAYNASLICLNGVGSFTAAGASPVDLIKDQVHWDFEDTIFDLRDGTFWATLDLFLYAGRFRNCRVRTPSAATGIAALGAGYEVLFSEESGVLTWTTPASAVPVFKDIQTKLFWLPKDGNLRLYPANAAAATAWSTIYPTWLRKGSAALADDEYYQGSATPSAISEDRRAPTLRLNFTTAPPISTELKIGWAVAVSP